MITAAIAAPTSISTATIGAVQAQPADAAPPTPANHSGLRYLAPIGHRQPRPQDLPRNVTRDQGTIGAWQRDFDKQTEHLSRLLSGLRSVKVRPGHDQSAADSRHQAHML
jgi:hypothetical protein